MWNCCAGMSQTARSPMARLLVATGIHVVLILYTKSQIKTHPCCMLLRKLVFFGFYFQFYLLASIPTGILLALIYTLSANARTSSSQKWHPKSHFLYNIITLMTTCSIIKVAHVISLFINHYNSLSICTAVTRSTFSHLQGPYLCSCRTIRIALSLNNGADGCLPYLFDLRLSSSMRPSLFYFQLTDIHEISQEKYTRCFPAKVIQWAQWCSLLVEMEEGTGEKQKTTQIADDTGDQQKGVKLTPIRVLHNFYLKMDIGSCFST